MLTPWCWSTRRRPGRTAGPSSSSKYHPIQTPISLSLDFFDRSKFDREYSCSIHTSVKGPSLSTAAHGQTSASSSGRPTIHISNHRLSVFHCSRSAMGASCAGRMIPPSATSSRRFLVLAGRITAGRQNFADGGGLASEFFLERPRRPVQPRRRIRQRTTQGFSFVDDATGSGIVSPPRTFGHRGRHQRQHAAYQLLATTDLSILAEDPPQRRRAPVQELLRFHGLGVLR